MKTISKIRSGLVAGAALAAALTGVAQAQQQTSLQDVLNAARQEQAESRRANQEREQRFVAERNQQQARVNQVTGQVNAANARSDQLDTAFAENENRIGELQAELDTVQGEFKELFGAAKTTANELAASLESSIISAQYPGRVEALRELGSTDQLPSEDELRNLYLTMIQEIVAQSEVASFEANVVQADGEAARETINRVGPFSAFTRDSFYTMGEVRSGRYALQQLSRQPAGLIDLAQNTATFSGSGYTAAPVDPSLGTLLDLTLETKTLEERLEDGGPVGKVILGVLAVGIILGLYKLVTLLMTSAAVKGQMRKKTASKSNPLGRVMMAYQSNTNADTETMALKLDDAVMKEVPKLESGLNLIKVLAAIAPLLGLLGTVIGMINTFQAITLFGTGDPQRMADGISEALITTVLGLVAAIPLLLLHAFAAGAARSVSNVLEEQSAGMIAEHAEARH